jgi:type IV pilus assembly protein PilM
LINRLLRGVTALFEPDVPRWAVELTESHVVAIGVSTDRDKIGSRAVVDLPSGSLVADIKERNILESETVRDALEKTLHAAGFLGSDVALVIPDDAVRITLLRVESLPASDAECQAIIRWKLRKTVPFNLDAARMAYQKLGEDGGVDLVVALTCLPVIEQYEELINMLGLHAGMVSPSTVAALNLLKDSRGDTLFVKKNPASVTTSILMDGRLRFFRRVPVGDLYDAVYPTLMYYQDKLTGGGLNEAFLCGPDTGDPDELATRLGVSMQPLHSSAVDDVYKPSFGVLQR